MKKQFLTIFIALLLIVQPLQTFAADSVVVPGFDSVQGIIDKISAGQSLMNSAVQAVPTKDTGLDAKETSISIFGFNIGVSWNQLAINIAKQVLNQIINSTINWMNSGFNGSPAFVTDPTGYFGGLANGLAGDIIKQSNVGFLCSPLQSLINVRFKLGLQQYYDQPYRPQCTITGIKGNIENFYEHFTNGGWASFIDMTQNPSNNPYGAYIGSEIQLDKRVASLLGAEKSKIDWGTGFKSQGDCITYNPSASDINDYENGIDNGIAQNKVQYDENKAPGECIKYGPDKTPGATIKSHLDSVLPANSVISQITTADQFDKLLSALGNGFLRKFVFGAGGLLGGGSGSGSGSGPSSAPPPTVACEAGPNPAVMNSTKVTWSADSNFQNKAVSFTWGGDDNLTGSGDSTSHTYTQFGTMNAYVLASTTDLDDLGNYIPGTQKSDQKFPCKPLLVTQWPPLSLVSCTPSVLTTKTDTQVTWTATIAGGSGVLNSYLWSGGQSSYPGCSITGVHAICSIWDPVAEPPAPTTPYAYSNGFPPPPQGKTVGTTLYTVTANPDKTTTLTATRVYFGSTGGHDGVKSGDTEDAQLQVFDAGQNVKPLTADCGSITIVP